MSRLRADLTAMEGYHSAQVEVAVRLNTNESPIGLPEEYSLALSQAVLGQAFHRYPDRQAIALRTAIASLEGVDVTEIYAANGSNEVIENLLLAFGGVGRSALVFEPSYALHAHLARTTATNVITVDRRADFSIDAQLVGSSVAMHQPVITFLCSPNNPTGEVVDASVVNAALDNGPGLVVVDEAYVQFADFTAMAVRNEQNLDRLVILRTFSKTWALAGIRLGFCIASPEVVRGLDIVTLPYHLSNLTQLAGKLALEYLDDMASRVTMIVSERNRISGELHALGFEVWPSQANFVLFRPANGRGHALWESLVRSSVLIRDCSSWPRLEGCLRVTVGTPKENSRFLEALKEAS
jgi:histidinol-phosphate aminotransferase